MATFDLLREPWIPVLRADGTTGEAGLRDALCEAHHLLAIRDPLPTVEFGLYRLLTACVLDIFEIGESVSALGRLMEEGSFTVEKVDDYFSRWKDRFDLFHPVYPFLQTAGMDSDPKPLAGMLPLIPSGTNANHFHHAHEDDFGVCPAAAARLLATISPFMTAGGAGLSPSINGGPPWYVLVAGENLFETLALNACAVPLPLATGNEPPAWRSDQPVETGRRNGASLLEALTWRPRRIQFIPDGPGQCSLTRIEYPVLVRTMRFAAGASCNFLWRDPSIPYRIGNDGPKPLRPQEGREVWRDSGPLALLQEGDYESKDGKVRFERPALVNQFSLLIDEGVLDRDKPLDLLIYGMRTDLKMKVFEWQRESLSLPVSLVWQSRFHREVQEAMDRADRAAYLIRQGIKRAYPRNGEGNKKAYDALIAAAQRQFWTSLRGEYEGGFLPELANIQPESDGSILAALRDRWNDRLKREARTAFDEATDDLDTDADALKRLTEARRFFLNTLNAILASEEEKSTRKRRSKRKPSK